MEEKFQDFKITIAEINKADKVALECAYHVPRRAVESIQTSGAKRHKCQAYTFQTSQHSYKF